MIASLMKDYTLTTLSTKGFLVRRLGICISAGPWASPATLWGYMNTMMATDMMEALKRVEIPTLIIYGSEGIICPVEGGIFIHQEIKGSALPIIKGGDHNITITCPEEVTRLIRESRYLTNVGMND